MKWWKESTTWLAIFFMFGVVGGLIAGYGVKQCPECPEIAGEYLEVIDLVRSNEADSILIAQRYIKIYYSKDNVYK